jgi:hypothetical protein
MSLEGDCSLGGETGFETSIMVVTMALADPRTATPKRAGIAYFMFHSVCTSPDPAPRLRQ